MIQLNKAKRLFFLFLSVLFFTNSNAQQQPNIVFILADDLGYGDIGPYGQDKIQTPNIDFLAANGLSFTNFYSGASVCSPSRSVLFTGKHTGHSTIRGNMAVKGGKPGPKGNSIVYRANILPEDTTFADILQRAGYETGLFGKWHIDGFDSLATPLQHGFSDFSGWLLNKPETYASAYWPAKWYRNGTLTDVPGNENDQQGYYINDLITDDAIQFLGKRKNDKKPFIAVIAHTVPHVPLDVSGTALYDNEKWPESHKRYASLVSSLDSSVGRITKYLKENGLDKNTIVFFASDNGAPNVSSRLIQGSNPPYISYEVKDDAEFGTVTSFFKSTASFRGYKGQNYEGGLRVPFIVWNEKLVPRGVRTDVPGYFADLLATFSGLAKAGTKYKSDGIDLSPYLLGKKTKAEQRFLYWESTEGPERFVQAIRYGKWKAIVKNEKLSLYDLDNDIHEDHDVSNDNPNVVAGIRKYLKTNRTESPYWPSKQ